MEIETYKIWEHDKRTKTIYQQPKIYNWQITKYWVRNKAKIWLWYFGVKKE
jgi:hypothetical protein